MYSFVICKTPKKIGFYFKMLLIIMSVLDGAPEKQTPGGKVAFGRLTGEDIHSGKQHLWGRKGGGGIAQREKVSRDAVVRDSSSDPTSSSDAEMALHSGPKLRLGARAFVVLYCSVIGCWLPLGKRYSLEWGSSFRPRAMLREDCSCEPSTANTPGSWGNKFLGPEEVSRQCTTGIPHSQ